MYTKILYTASRRTFLRNSWNFKQDGITANRRRQETATETHRSLLLPDYAIGNSRRKYGRHSGKSVSPNSPLPLLPLAPRRPLTSSPFQIAFLFSREGCCENSQLTTLAQSEMKMRQRDCQYRHPRFPSPQTFPSFALPTLEKIEGTPGRFFFPPRRAASRKWRGDGRRSLKLFTLNLAVIIGDSIFTSRRMHYFLFYPVTLYNYTLSPYSL